MNKSGNSSQTISLPQGVDALHGGETFSPDFDTGTGNFTVPIALPPGRSGFQPQLNLVYSTGNGNGRSGPRGAHPTPPRPHRPARGPATASSPSKAVSETRPQAPARS